jgi:hypothetical protein
MPFANSPVPSHVFFLHGLDSSIRGTKAQWFKRHFPMRLHDFDGDLDRRRLSWRSRRPGLTGSF